MTCGPRIQISPISPIASGLAVVVRDHDVGRRHGQADRAVNSLPIGFDRHGRGLGQAVALHGSVCRSRFHSFGDRRLHGHAAADRRP